MPVDRSSPASERAPVVMTELRGAYPQARIALNFSTPLECLVATVLSAQSTDVMVNQVTDRLFIKYKRPEDYLAVPEEELQEDIHATGFFRQKTKSLRGLSQKLLDDFDGEVPSSIRELVSLPGVARKTANIVQANCFPRALKGDPDAGIAVDTHVGRLSVRLALTERTSKEAEKIEDDLKELFDREDWPVVPYLLIEHGRHVCDAKQPQCEDCVVEPLCPSSQEAGLPDLYRDSARKKSTARKGSDTRKKSVRKKTARGGSSSESTRRRSL
jgi:endonuclease-3